MQREIKFRAKHEGKIWDVWAMSNSYKQHGYIKRKVNRHPYTDIRGYVMEHRLVMESFLCRFLKPRKELIHHMNGDRSDNALANLKLSNPKDHAKGHVGERNPNGQFVCLSPEFNEKKFRLYDKDRNITQIYTLNELISKTFRRGKFEYRGTFTGLKDKNGKMIFEGDVVKWLKEKIAEVRINPDIQFVVSEKEIHYPALTPIGFEKEIEIIGDIYSNPNLIN